MALVIEDTVRLLMEFDLMPIEKCVSEDDAADIRKSIQNLIIRLENRGLPPNDPLRYHETGRRLSERELSIKLEQIIQGWASWRKYTPKRKGRYGK